jgi:hypothetical protein
MALPHSRKLVVNGTHYEYMVHRTKDRFGLGWTPRELSVTLKDEVGTLSQFVLKSKYCTPEQIEVMTGGPRAGLAPPHKVALTPFDVKQLALFGVECQLGN